MPTPIVLVEEMLDNIYIQFQKKTNKVFDLCYGMGKFVMNTQRFK